MAVARSDAPVVLLCGYYGEDNLGDDALLQVLLQQLPSGFRPLITAHDRDAVKRLAPEAAVVNRRSLRAVLASVGQVNAVVLGGGSLLQDSTSFRSLVYYLILIVVSRLRGRPVILWGQGLGPLRRRFSRFLVRLVLPLCTAASWRDQRSWHLAQRLAPALPMQTAPDPVWQMPRRTWSGGGGIVLSWRPTPLLDKQGWRGLLDVLEQLAVEQDLQIRWLAFHQHQDATLLADLHSQGLVSDQLLQRSSTVVPRGVEAVVDAVRDARLVLPMRLHALILARLVCCPMAALSYDPKVEAAAEASGVVWSSLQNPSNPQALLSQWRSALDRPADPLLIDSIREQAELHRKVFQNIL